MKVKNEVITAEKAHKITEVRRQHLMFKSLNKIMEKIHERIDAGYFDYEFYDYDEEILNDEKIQYLRELGYTVELSNFSGKDKISW